MAHQASYRVYRPRRFSEVQGQSHTVKTLQEAVRQGRLTHAYVFSGPRGTGKTSVARILAKAVNCENLGADGDPCLNCPSCRALEQGSHLDVIEIDAASNRGIDEIRDIKERVTHQTAMSPYKVYIIDEAHMLTPEAFNAFLKTLEEPLPHVLFVLATTEAQKLPVTVLSRCQRYEFQRLSVAIIADRLRFVAHEEHVDAEPQALELLAEAADGALRDALSLFDQVVAAEGRISTLGVTRVAGLVGLLETRELVDALSGGIEQVVTVLGELRQNGVEDKLILRALARTFRDILLYRSVGAELFPDYRRQGLAEMDSLLPKDIDPAWWIDAVDQLATAETRLRGGFPPDLAVELVCLKIQQQLHAPVSLRPTGGGQTPEPVLTSDPHRQIAPKDPEEAEPRPRDYQEVLAMVKRERPSTYALFERTSGTIDQDGTLIVHFEFPAHRKLMDQPHNRDVVDKAIKSVFGDEARYRFEDDVAQPAQKPDQVKSLKKSVQEWVGPDVRLIGFDQE